MKIPDGSFVAESGKPIPEALKEYGQNFRGCIHVYKAEDGRVGEGFILIEDGSVIASAYNMMGITLYQMSALQRMMSLRDVRLKIYSYSDKDSAKLLELYPDSSIDGVSKKEPSGGVSEEPATVVSEADDGSEIRTIPYETLLSAVVQMPGVMAAALVVDGFPIYQEGEQVDFEHIAVATEDMVRSGTRISTELQLGTTEQIILETPDHKVVISPINDMFLCVLTGADANLGLVRLSIKNAQRNMREQ